MGEIIQIDGYRPTCRNCKYGRPDPDNPGWWTCERPDGWHFDAKFRFCATFERREVAT